MFFKKADMPFSGLILILFLFVTATTAQSQTAELIVPEKTTLVPGKIAVYLSDTVMPHQAEEYFDALNLDITETDIGPTRAFIVNITDASVAKELKSHPSVERVQVSSNNASTEPDYPENMTKEEKERFRKQIMELRKKKFIFVSFNYRVTGPMAEDILRGIDGIEQYNISSPLRIVYVQVEEGTEAEQMERLRAFTFVNDVTRVAENEFYN